MHGQPSMSGWADRRASCRSTGAAWASISFCHGMSSVGDRGCRCPCKWSKAERMLGPQDPPCLAACAA
eukprot:52744-Prorocentrum_lima.AAC.1